ncbi:hypothetical protein KSP40_PGU008646 [Platanthera guangdongensis]|uniref:Uncharacterized protein n=1 Tax=Platanthera guangdongensis TaxID=2320717 RepID=A0ABR2MFE1_9ASPA
MFYFSITSACIKDVKEKVFTLKMDEIQYLKSLLQQVEEQNSDMESQIQSLKQNMGLSNAMNAVEKVFRSPDYTLFKKTKHPLLLSVPSVV